METFLGAFRGCFQNFLGAVIGAEMAQITANVGLFWGASVCLSESSVSRAVFLTGFVHVFCPLCINVTNEFLNFVGRAGKHASAAYSRLLFPRSRGFSPKQI